MDCFRDVLVRATGWGRVDSLATAGREFVISTGNCSRAPTYNVAALGRYTSHRLTAQPSICSRFYILIPSCTATPQNWDNKKKAGVQFFGKDSQMTQKTDDLVQRGFPKEESSNIEIGKSCVCVNVGGGDHRGW